MRKAKQQYIKNIKKMLFFIKIIQQISPYFKFLYVLYTKIITPAFLAEILVGKIDILFG
jgi:hypothetical protein